MLKTKILAIFLSVFTFIGCQNNQNQEVKSEANAEEISNSEPTFGIVIHGGAGTILKKNMTDSLELAYKATLEEAIRTGHSILEQGGTAMEAVTKTINVMENSPLFNEYKIRPSLLVREGLIEEEIIKLIEEDESINMLIVGTEQETSVKSKIITAIVSQIGSKIHIPMTIIPGNLTDQEISLLT